MAVEINEWFQKVTEEKKGKDIPALVDELLAEKTIEPVGAYEMAQKLGIDYRDNKGGIPDDLRETIIELANRDSGFTGLTIHEAWIGMNRKK